jgi:hypothetical protein
MNGWYAHSLGATEAAGHVFLALGLAADLVALALPSFAAGRWQGVSESRRWPDGASGCLPSFSP